MEWFKQLAAACVCRNSRRAAPIVKRDGRDCGMYVACLSCVLHWYSAFVLLVVLLLAAQTNKALARRNVNVPPCNSVTHRRHPGSVFTTSGK